MIHSFEYSKKQTKEVGVVEEVKDFLVKISGLKGASMNEGVSFETGEHGQVIELEAGIVEVLVLSRVPIKPGTLAARSGRTLSISCGEGVLGRVLDPLGHTMDERRDESKNPELREIQVAPLGISARERITANFVTDVPVVDLVVPIGEGQRELVIGDRKTGKTHFLLQAILAQAKKGTICIYAAIGKKKAEIKSIEEFFIAQKIENKTIVIAADSYASSGEIFLAPFTAMTIAEYFRDQGKNVFVIMDDLTTHAKYYREIALLSGRFPARESYPGDIFHIHSKLLERAGCFKGPKGPVSITCFPLADSQQGDITGFIQTNLMSMTDGHIFFDSEIYFEGRRPAVNIFLSVTRVGRQTQSPLNRDLGKKILEAIKKYEDAQRFLRFGPEISESLQGVLHLGENLQRFLNQVSVWSIPLPLASVGAAMIWNEFWDGRDVGGAVVRYGQDADAQKLAERLSEKAKSLDELMEMVTTEKLKLQEIFRGVEVKEKPIEIPTVEAADQIVEEVK